MLDYRNPHSGREHEALGLIALISAVATAIAGIMNRLNALMGASTGKRPDR